MSGTLTAPLFDGGADPATNTAEGALYCKSADVYWISATGVVKQITGIYPLSVPNGGTGLSSITSGTLLIGNGSSAAGTFGFGSNGNYCVSNGSTWTTESHAPGQASATVAWGADTSEHTLGSVVVTVGTSGNALFTVSCPFNYNNTSSSQITFRMKVDGTTKDTILMDCIPDVNTPEVRNNFAWSEVITGLTAASHTFSMTVQNTSSGSVGATSSATGRVTVVPI